MKNSCIELAKLRHRLAALAAVSLIATVPAFGNPIVAANSPDLRNTIQIKADPLRYSVMRDGVVMVGETPIGLTVDGKPLAVDFQKAKVTGPITVRESLDTPVYKKSRVDLTRTETFADFGDWGIRLVARNDGVAYRFETKMPGTIRVNDEQAGVTIPDADATTWAYPCYDYGLEEMHPQTLKAKDVGNDLLYLPLTWKIGEKVVSVVDSDLCDYSIWDLRRDRSVTNAVAFKSDFAKWPAKTSRVEFGRTHRELVTYPTGGRKIRVDARENWIVDTDGSRTFPWRGFILADRIVDLCSADLVYALARPAAAGDDFAWVRPGKVAWDWWNFFDNGAGCNTRTYERFIDFASKNGVEYVIFDEGWSEKLNIWKFHPDVDVPHLIDYAAKRNVGIILWMAWAQVAGDEDRIAEHFAKLGAKGFKVDFMDRGDADCERFYWKFAEACRKHRMLVDYHGSHRPTGLSRTYPNVLNYEGVHGLENMRGFKNTADFTLNELGAFFLRMAAGPMDFTPGAMLNHPIGNYQRGKRTPGSVGTRCRQMAMIAMYEAPLQMLCDSPTHYEKNAECFAFMAKTPVVWAQTVGLDGTPNTFAACAREAKDGAWYLAAMSNSESRDIELDTSFLGKGEWTAEVFRDAPECDTEPTKYVHETIKIRAGEKLPVHLARGGGFIARISK